MVGLNPASWAPLRWSRRVDLAAPLFVIHRNVKLNRGLLLLNYFYFLLPRLSRPSWLSPSAAIQIPRENSKTQRRTYSRQTRRELYSLKQLILLPLFPILYPRLHPPSPLLRLLVSPLDTLKWGISQHDSLPSTSLAISHLDQRPHTSLISLAHPLKRVQFLALRSRPRFD